MCALGRNDAIRPPGDIPIICWNPRETARMLPGGDELTPTMKLKRKPIAAKYAQEIEAL